MSFNLLFNRNQPKIQSPNKKIEGYNGWVKCSDCGELIHEHQLNNNLQCCPKCNYHFRMKVEERIKLLVQENSFEEMFQDLESKDPLKFQDKESYGLKLQEAQKKSKRKDAIVTGTAMIGKIKTALAVMDFSFMGGSMGAVVGEKLTLLIEYATKNQLPLVIVSASGGARMQESMFSLVQMAKTSQALAKHSEANLFFLSILTHPTMGGVTASFASLGDVMIAEPKALIGFAGPRVIEQTIGQKLPKGAQTAEFLLEKGMIDAIVSRNEMRKKVEFLVEFFHPEQKKIKKKNLKSVRLLDSLNNQAHRQEIEYANA